MFNFKKTVLFFFIFLIILALHYIPITTKTVTIEIIGPILTSNNVTSKLKNSISSLMINKIILVVDSPGGSMVHAENISSNIIKLKKKYPDKKIISYIVNQCFSSCYYIVSHTDKIYANKFSNIGNIGIVQTLPKPMLNKLLIIESAPNKSFLDPYTPIKQEELAHAKNIVQIVYRDMVKDIKHLRGDKFKTEVDLFTGFYWVSKDALRLGLIDDICSLSDLTFD